MLTNERKFDSFQYGKESIVPQTKVEYIRFSPFLPQEFAYEVFMTRLNLQDLAIDLDQLTELEDFTVFNMNPKPSTIAHNPA